MSMTKRERVMTALVERVRLAIGEMGGRHLLRGPNCPIDPDTPQASLHAVAAAACEAR